MTVSRADRVEVAGVAVSPDHYIGGRRVASAARFEDRSPIDQSLLAEVARAGAGEVDEAVRAAHDAFPALAALGPACSLEWEGSGWRDMRVSLGSSDS